MYNKLHKIIGLNDIFADHLILINTKSKEMDTKDQILEAILRNVRTEVSMFLEDESKITCPIEYEQKLIEMSRNFARTVIEKGQGKMPKSRNFKKK